MKDPNNLLFKQVDTNSLYLFKEIATLLNTIYIQFINKNYASYRHELSGVNGELLAVKTVDMHYLFDNIKKNIISIDKEIIELYYSEEDRSNFKKFINWAVTELVNFYEKMANSKYSKTDAFLNLINIIFKLFSEFSDFLNFSIVNRKIFDDFINMKIDSDLSDKTSLNNVSYDNLNNRLIVFENRMNELENKTVINSDLFDKAINNFLKEQKISFDKSIVDTINSFRHRLDSLYNEYTNELVLKVSNLQFSVDNSKNEVDNLDNAIESYKSAVSTKIQNEISKHYQKKATMEMWTYWGATIFSILLILGSLGLLAWGLIDYYHDYISTSSCLNNENFKSCVARLETIRDITKNIGISFFIMRFVFSLLLFLTVIYTSRIAGRAYSHWRHSENMHLKLSSLEPFITELPKDVRHEIHRELIPDYFGKDAGLVDTANDKFKDLPANVSAVAMKAIEQISGGGSNSSTEKNGKKPEGGTE
ncbi:MAG: hypothetical protein WCC23_07715 [Acinetobacter calcoaceticus]